MNQSFHDVIKIELVHRKQFRNESGEWFAPEIIVIERDRHGNTQRHSITCHGVTNAPEFEIETKYE